ncbi:hypothetical protein COCVIDRAFT_21365 [Bipolaris victoriae FI3]|uniref:Uncharacterized protein n=1 Tax=Bipolaris victoriae (strain FI3) TaxID=930091 RepID=W7E3B3_BIPV3|nr:hypothetical protein COCVIDRAFT_21365 [Bipolaris victoriae FI3]
MAIQNTSLSSHCGPSAGWRLKPVSRRTIAGDRAEQWCRDSSASRAGVDRGGRWMKTVSQPASETDRGRRSAAWTPGFFRRGPCPRVGMATGRGSVGPAFLGGTQQGQTAPTWAQGKHGPPAVYTALT